MNLEIGAKIKQLRLARGMTQEQLGKPLRLSAQAVSKWESGEFPKVKDTTSIPRGLLLNRYSRRAG